MTNRTRAPPTQKQTKTKHTTPRPSLAQMSVNRANYGHGETSGKVIMDFSVTPTPHVTLNTGRAGWANFSL